MFYILSLQQCYRFLCNASIIDSFDKYLLSIYHMPGPILDTWGYIINKRDQTQ